MDLGNISSLFEFVSKVVRYRSEERKRVFAEELLPLAEILEQNHSEFLVMLEKLDVSIRSIRRGVKNSQKDFKQALHDAQLQIQQLGLTRRKGTAGRRKLYEEAKVRHENVEERLFKKLALTEEELKAMQAFYKIIFEYLTVDDRYGHHLGYFITTSEEYLNDIDDDWLDTQTVGFLDQMHSEIVEYESELRRFWGEFSRELAVLKTSLTN